LPARTPAARGTEQIASLRAAQGKPVDEEDRAAQENLSMKEDHRLGRSRDFDSLPSRIGAVRLGSTRLQSRHHAGADPSSEGDHALAPISQVNDARLELPAR
jgi:hypothetical protein